MAQYGLTAEPAGLIGSTLLSSGYLRRAGEAFKERAEEVDAFLAGRRPTPFTPKDPATSRELRQALDDRAARLAESPYAHGVAADLAGLIALAPSAELDDLRVRRLARMLDLSERAAAEVCLAAVDVGLLTRRFVALCPRCRRPVVEAASLADLPERARCDVDGVEFAIDLAVNVETLFAPAPSARPTEPGAFCASGPMTAPHVLIQQRLEPGERRAFPYVARPGSFRVRIEASDGRVAAAPEEEAPQRSAGRAPNAGDRGIEEASVALARGDVAFDYAGGAFPTIAAAAEGAALGADAPDGAVVFENHSSRQRLICLERREWRADALTAAEASPLQAYRALFPTDAPRRPMRAGRLVFVGFVLQASVAVFATRNDVEAADRIDAFFAAAVDCARRRNGGVVRAQGDRGLAAFLDPLDAASFAVDLRGAALEQLPAIAAPGADDAAEGARAGETNAASANPRAALGVGIASGRALALQRGGRFDYAGLAPSLAERLSRSRRSRRSGGSSGCRAP